jgi:hypothetical protein
MGHTRGSRQGLSPETPPGELSAEMDNFLLIIGAMKSGTTSLFMYLAGHPEIAPARVKEPGFFAEADKWSRSWAWYESLWDWNPRRHKYAMEASTCYTKQPAFPNAVERIATAPARFKFIYLMRHPIERIESHLTHAQMVPQNLMEVSTHAIAVSNYARQLDDYYKRFPANDIKLLMFEDFKLQPVEVITDICSFLGLDASFDCERIGIAYNQSKDRTRIVNPIIRSLRWSRAGSMLSKMLPADVRGRIKAKIDSRPLHSVHLSPKQKEESLAVLMPDLRRLQRDYGVDVSRWGINL